MKVGILTHPLIGNYGGILQALSLQEFLKSIGHEVIILDRRHNLSKTQRFIKCIGKFLRIKRFVNTYPIYTEQIRFIDKYIKRTTQLYSTKELSRAILTNDLDYVVIGSDQVWNLDYSKLRGHDYWGGFEKSPKTKIFSYAASMGNVVWDLPSETTLEIANMLKNFVGISVREFQMVDLLNKNLGLTDVKWVVDPTFLHENQFYDKYVAERSIERPYVFIYWLGDENLIPPLPPKYHSYIIKKCKLGNPEFNLSMEEWLSAIKYADLVITDSFHGCALSVIYKKNFMPCSNSKGGKSRLESLFKLLDIDYDLSSHKPIVSEQISSIENIRMSSLEFIQNIFTK